jgi:hypothetical protein
MRDPLRVDDAYYISHQTDYSAFADAVMDVGPAPCTKFDCPRQQQCAEESVECKAFRYWVNEGTFTTYRKKLKREISIEHEMQKLLKPIK